MGGAQSYECSVCTAHDEQDERDTRCETQEVEMHADDRLPIRLIVRGIQFKLLHTSMYEYVLEYSQNIDCLLHFEAPTRQSDCSRE